MSILAVIGGTGLTELPGLTARRAEHFETPWGEPSGPVIFGRLSTREIAFLPRHGHGHTIAPHRINYRANIWALKALGIQEVIAVAAVGGIRPSLGPGALVVPDQIIDYTWGRAQTFHDGLHAPVHHVDFTRPYSARLRSRLVSAADVESLPVTDGGTYGATQGPRLETAAEIDRMERDGCDVVGMTGMPEAGLAREVQLDYAHLAVVVNPAAGRGAGEIKMDAIEFVLTTAMEKVKSILVSTVALLGSSG